MGVDGLQSGIGFCKGIGSVAGAGGRGTKWTWGIGGIGCVGGGNGFDKCLVRARDRSVAEAR
jgi:hypothetical protein